MFKFPKFVKISQYYSILFNRVLSADSPSSPSARPRPGPARAPVALGLALTSLKPAGWADWPAQAGLAGISPSFSLLLHAGLAGYFFIKARLARSALSSGRTLFLVVFFFRLHSVFSTFLSRPLRRVVDMASEIN